MISLDEIKKRATKFSYEFKDETSERAEAQTFWNEFFKIFNINRRRIASFEKPTIKVSGKGSIDLFWKGKLVVEHKSSGLDLNMAYNQALSYFHGLKDEELPKYVIVTDFKRIRLYDLEENKTNEFPLEELVNNIKLFDFIHGYEKVETFHEDPVNTKAAELVGKLHDSLKENGYIGHDLEELLVRIVFCLFADDTGIFDEKKFYSLIENKTQEDGSDVGQIILTLFETLNTPKEERQKNLDIDFSNFPYIDGNLFKNKLSIPFFDKESRKILISCCHFDWSKISPAIFGSMFQSVMNPKERHNLGAHYTSEKNIMKTIDELFLNELKEEFELNKNNKLYLNKMREKIGKIRILDPACGCGNFLIVSYRELRRLQIMIHKQLNKLEIWSTKKQIKQFRKKESRYSEKNVQQFLQINFDEDLDVDSMYGIEILEFPARIAEVGLWLMDHLINKELSKELGYYYERLPLKKSASIFVENALECDWNKIVSKNELTYIIGNPPFVSKQDRDDKQKKDMENVCKEIKNCGLLDYVSCWYVKAAEYIQETDIKVAFVSTNSITQGEQVGVLWNYLDNKKNIKRNFAHRTFKWSNDARGKANVYVIIIGFSMKDEKNKFIFEYENPSSEPLKIKANNINPYLVDAENIYIINKNKPFGNVPEISFGNQPNDGGNLLLNYEEKELLEKNEPQSKKYIKEYIGAEEFLNNKKRWCLWLKDILPSELNKLNLIKQRIIKVKDYRMKSKRKETIELANTPYLFGYINQPNSDYILIPYHSSENRKYIPMGLISKDKIIANSCGSIQNTTNYHFGILSSEMHMVWVNQICGRIKSDYRYSNNLVYNNFPWPENPSEKEIKKIEKIVLEIIKIRKELSKKSSISEMYNPISMPKNLFNAHKKLDKVVEKCYRKKPFKTNIERLEFLFNLYKKYIHQENN